METLYKHFCPGCEKYFTSVKKIRKFCGYSCAGKAKAGWKHSEDVRKKMSIKATGRVHTEKVKKQIGESVRKTIAKNKDKGIPQ